TPFINAPWLSAKVSALVLYIGLGFAALRLTHPLARRLAVGVAIGCYAYIVGVAISKTPLSWWAL
ncbi:MAG: regulator SirB, partial [Anaerolineae bacterium]|nr:regulator SirB [Anaerolineae bacterium]